MATLLQLIYFMLPAYIANMAPIFVRTWSFLDVPLDGGATLFGKRVFGAHKTVRGIFFGLIAGVLMAGVQKLLAPTFPNVGLLSYDGWILVGLLLGGGALLGDAIKSFFKRQFGVASGKAWIPFDQIDYAIGAIGLASIVYFPGWLNAAYIIIISVILHFVVNIIGYFLKIRKQMW
jgi:CDP-2,3-bis-(O-geranylgeranyl)-sn-glycerol synthase